MSRLLRLATLFLLISIPILLVVGCDEPNSADLPPRPYNLISVYPTSGLALDVDGMGDYVAVAASDYGAMVLNVSNLGSPTPVFHEPMQEFAASRRVAIDTLHHFVYSDHDGSDLPGEFPLYNYLTGNRDFPGSVPFSSNVDEVIMESRPDSVILFRTDYSSGDGLQSELIHFVGDTAWQWDSIYRSFWAGGWQPVSARIRGLGRRDDNMIAVAMDEDGIHIHDANTPMALADTFTVGTAYDCAWYGNYIFVADRYCLTIVDATDLTQPFVATSLTIPTSDRMIKIEIDAHYALVLDEYDGVYVIDISNPLVPLYLQLLDLPEPTSLSADNGRLFVSDAVRGLVIYSR